MSTSTIMQDKVVEIHYTLRRSDGHIEDSTEGEPALPYLHGAGTIVPGLEQALEGRKEGDQFNITIEPGDAYGEYDDELREEIPVQAFPEDIDLTEGDEIFFQDEDGNEVTGYIERVEDGTVYVNYNHPLAGETVTFEVKVVNVRDATPEELQQGYANDPYEQPPEDEQESDEEGWEEDEEWEDDDWEDDWDDEWDDEDEEEWDDDLDWDEDENRQNNS